MAVNSSSSQVRPAAPTRLLRSAGRLQLSVRFPCRLLGRGKFRKEKNNSDETEKKPNTEKQHEKNMAEGLVTTGKVHPEVKISLHPYP